MYIFLLAVISEQHIILPCTSSYSPSCFVRGRQQRSSPSAQVCSLGRSSGLVPEVSVPLWSRRQCSHHYQRLRDDTTGSMWHTVAEYLSFIQHFLSNFPFSTVQIKSMTTHDLRNHLSVRMIDTLTIKSL